MPTEEERAIEYRRKMTARGSWEYDQRFKALPGDPDRARAVRAGFEPIANKDRGWDPPAEFEGTGSIHHTPLGPRLVGEGRQLV